MRLSAGRVLLIGERSGLVWLHSLLLVLLGLHLSSVVRAASSQSRLKQLLAVSLLLLLHSVLLLQLKLLDVAALLAELLDNLVGAVVIGRAVDLLVLLDCELVLHEVGLLVVVGRGQLHLLVAHHHVGVGADVLAALLLFLLAS